VWLIGLFSHAKGRCQLTNPRGFRFAGGPVSNAFVCSVMAEYSAPTASSVAPTKASATIWGYETPQASIAS